MTNNTWGYEVFRSRVRLVGTLTLCAGMRIGAGRDLGLGVSDLPVVKDISGRPYIPGSSLKGVLRAGMESWLRGLFAEYTEATMHYACNPTHRDEQCIPIDAKRDLIRGKDSRTADAALWEKSCWTCRLLGSHWIASKTQIRDLDIEAGWRPEYFMIRDGVAIDRESETAAPRMKYDFEALPAGTQFSVEILIENPQPYEMGLLLAAIDLLDRGYILMGGGKSRGLGRVRLTIDNVEELTPQSFLDLFPLPDAAAPEAVPAAEATLPTEPTAPKTSSPETPQDAPPAVEDNTDPYQALVNSVRALRQTEGKADSNSIPKAMQDRDWTKNKLQAKFPSQKQFNYAKLCETAVRNGLIVALPGGRYALPGEETSPAAASASSSVSEAVPSGTDTAPPAPSAVELKTILWKRELRARLQAEMQKLQQERQSRPAPEAADQTSESSDAVTPGGV